MATAVLTDYPWRPERSRSAAFLTLLLSGTIGGAVQGVSYYAYCLSGSWLHGDALAWDAVELFTAIGFAVGLSVGIVFASSRKLSVRVTLSPALAVLAVYAALRLYSGGRPVLVWLSFDADADPHQSLNPSVWASWLGSTGAATLACTGHVLRRFRNRVKLTALALLILTLVAARLQSLVPGGWIETIPLYSGGCFAPPHGREVPLSFGATVSVLITASLLLYGNLFGTLLVRLGRPRLIPVASLALTVFCFSGIAWAADAMPRTDASPLKELSFAEESDRFYTAHEGETLRKWKIMPRQPGRPPIARQTEAVRLRHGPYRYPTYALSPTLLAAGSVDGWIALWELPSARLLMEFKTPLDEIHHLALSRNGGILVAQHQEQILLWALREDAADGSLVADLQPGFAPEPGAEAMGFSLSPDGRRIAILMKPDLTVVYDLRSRKEHLRRDKLMDYRRHYDIPLFSEDGRHLTYRLKDGTHIIEDLLTKKTAAVPAGSIPLRLSADARLLAVRDGDSLQILDRTSGKVLKTVGKEYSESFGGFSPDGRRFLMIEEDGSIDVFDCPR